VPPKRRFLQEPHGVTTQKTPFFKLVFFYTSLLPELLISIPFGFRVLLTEVFLSFLQFLLRMPSIFP
jgi:hypothetical protein